MIQNVIFDCSDTLLRSGCIEFLEQLTANKAKARQIHHALFGSPAWYDYDCGNIEEKDLQAALLPLLQQEDRQIGKIYLDGWIHQYSVIPGIPELLKKLKETGHRLYVLSDFPSCFEQVYNRFDLFQLFDGRVISYEEGKRKSDGVLFERLLQKYDLKAEECFFTDDVSHNVAIAQKYGIKGHVFTTVHALCDALLPLIKK